MSGASGGPLPVVIGADVTRASLPFDRLVPALREAFTRGAEVPLRHHHFIPQPGGGTSTILIMPAWQRQPSQNQPLQRQSFLGIKIVTIFPENGNKCLPGLHSSYLLCDGATGQHLALIDGNEITSRRTVAVAALGASYLARETASSLLIVGAGRVASLTAYAFRAVRSIERVMVWNIRAPRAETLAQKLREDGFDAQAVTDLEAAVKAAEIVSCATLATQPLIKGAWLKPGAHLDLIGSFTPFMREADDEVFRRGRVHVDTLDALKESGELIDPIANGAFASDSIVGTLAQLCRGECSGRKDDSEITVFKAVGNALPDLAAASLVYRDVFDPAR